MKGSQYNNRAKILIAITQGEMGGAQRYVFDLATSLSKEIFEILVVMGNEKTELAPRLLKAGVQVQFAKHLKRGIKPIDDIWEIFELKRIVKNFRPQILHLNSTKAGVLGSIAGRLAGVPNIVFTAHGFHFLEPNSWLIRKISFWFEKIASKYRKAIITVSEFDRRKAIKAKLCLPEKLITVHNGINLENLRLLARSNAKQYLNSTFNTNSKFLIGTIAHLYPAKGLEYLVTAAKSLRSKFPDIKFMVMGEGNQRKDLESRIKNYGLENDFFLLGEKENATQYLSAFDLFVLPSLKEGFPYVLLEAMASGLPIVATTVGGIPEAIQNGKDGLLVEPANADALAKAIGTLLANPRLAKQFGVSASGKSLGFSLEKMVRETENVYRELLSDF